MSTQANPAAAQPMTQEQLNALISGAVKEAIPSAVADAIAPHAKAQTDQLTEFRKALGTGEAGPAFDDVKVMGKYHIGKKAMALALATIKGVPVQDTKALAKAVKDAGWKASYAEPTLKWLDHVEKTTMSAGVAATAGDMVFPEMDPEWIALLRNNAVIRGIARTVPMPRGAMTRRKQTGAGTASYQGELGPITMSNQTVGRANLSYKKLTAGTVVSNDLILYAGGDADRLVEEDLAAVSGLREDRAFLVGNPPTDIGSPQGVRYQTKSTHIYATAGATLANFQADITKAIQLIETDNVRITPENGYLLLSPATFWALYALATTTGDMIFAAMLSGAQPRLFGFPVLKTTQLAIANSWIGASSGMIFLVHAPSLEIHDSQARRLEVFRGGAYYDGTVVQSGISNDETVITCISEHDFLQTYDVAASIITGYAT